MCRWRRALADLVGEKIVFEVDVSVRLKLREEVPDQVHFLFGLADVTLE